MHISPFYLPSKSHPIQSSPCPPGFCHSPPHSTGHLGPLMPNITCRTHIVRSKNLPRLLLACKKCTLVLHEQALPAGKGLAPFKIGDTQGLKGAACSRGTLRSLPPPPLPMPQRCLHPRALPHTSWDARGRVCWQRQSREAAAPAPNTSCIQQEAEAAERRASHPSSAQLLLLKVLLCPLEQVGKLCQTNPARYPPPLDLGKQCEPLTS